MAGPTYNSTSYVVLLSGTHVTGKETLAITLSKSLNCPWIKADSAKDAALSAARSQAKRGYSYSEVFGRIWLSKLQRLGLPLHITNRSDRSSSDDFETPRNPGPACTALITCGAMRKIDRDAMRDVMLANMIRPVFVIMQITEETLSGRTLGAEEPELAERIMNSKRADIEVPLEEEMDVVVIDSMRDVDDLFLEIREGISRQVADD